MAFYSFSRLGHQTAPSTTRKAQKLRETKHNSSCLFGSNKAIYSFPRRGHQNIPSVWRKWKLKLSKTGCPKLKLIGLYQSHSSSHFTAIKSMMLLATIRPSIRGVEVHISAPNHVRWKRPTKIRAYSTKAAFVKNSHHRLNKKGPLLSTPSTRCSRTEIKAFQRKTHNF